MLDYLSRPDTNATLQMYTAPKIQNYAEVPQYLPIRTTNMYYQNAGSTVIQCCPWNPGRTRPKTFYSLLHHGNQGPHTIPFALLRAHFMICTGEQMDELIPNPDEFEEMLRTEEISDSAGGLQEYTDIFNAYIDKRKEGIEGDEAEHVGAWDEYGWRPLGEMLVNRLPYATSCWRNNNGASDATLAAKGTERRAVTSYKRNGVISVDEAINSLDIPRGHGIQNRENLQNYLLVTLQQMVAEKDIEDLRQRIESISPRVTRPCFDEGSWIL